MSVRIIEDTADGMAVLYDSVTETAFGPVIRDLDVEEAGENVSAGTVAEEFLRWLDHKFQNGDARKFSTEELRVEYGLLLDLIAEDGWYGVFGEEVGSGV